MDTTKIMPRAFYLILIALLTTYIYILADLFLPMGITTDKPTYGIVERMHETKSMTHSVIKRDTTYCISINEPLRQKRALYFSYNVENVLKGQEVDEVQVYLGPPINHALATEFATKEDAKTVIKLFDEKPELFVIKN